MNNINKNEEEKVSFIGKMKASFSGRKLKSGAYVSLMSVIVVVILLVLNMLVSSMKIEFDLSSQKLYSLTDDTKNLVKDLKDDITVYYMVQTGNEVELFKKVFNKYEGLSDKLTIEYKDPVLYPAFAKEYTDEEIGENSLIVVDNTNGKSKYIPYEDMIVQELDQSTYTMNTTGVDVEGELTSALQYLTSEELPVMYVVEGHGEIATGDIFKETISKMNVDMETLNTMTAKSIPEDCKLLFINSPATDFSENEITLIKDYLNAGGNIIATVNQNTSRLTNYKVLLDYYGIEVKDGIVFEGNANMHMADNPILLVPTLERHEITSKVSASNIPIVMYQCSGLGVAETKRSSLKLEALMTTSEDAFAKVNYKNTIEKEEGDVEGPFNLGILATDTYNGNNSHLVVYATDYTFHETSLTYANASLLSGNVSFLVGDGKTLSIPTKSLGEQPLYPTAMGVIIWMVALVLLIPISILITGIVVTVSRRKK